MNPVVTSAAIFNKEKASNTPVIHRQIAVTHQALIVILFNSFFSEAINRLSAVVVV